MTDNKKSNNKESGDGGGEEGIMTPEQRLEYLRSHGIQVETAEERRAKEASRAARESNHAHADADADADADDPNTERISYVYVPHDSSVPLQELTFPLPRSGIGSSNGADFLVEHLKPAFASADGGKDVDLDLLRDHNTSCHLGTGDAPPQVSEEAMRAVARAGSVEVFRLVPPMDSNRHLAVNVYLDEVGMLKRLPPNARASELALRAGFNPAPQFYGDVFVGRVSNRPFARNVDFKLGIDTDPNAPWLQRATMENLEFQTAMNKISGRQEGELLQPSADGEDGVAKEERGGLYSWTQTAEEVEIVVPLKSKATSKDIKVSFRPRKVAATFRGEPVVQVELYAAVDPDGCTWTLENDSSSSSEDGSSRLVISCEKSDEISWPRITK